MDIAKTTLWRNLRNLTLHPYNFRLTQELKPMEHMERHTFSDRALGKMRQDDQFHRRVIFSDKAHFWLYGLVNKQNMQYWAGEKPLHPQTITVWFGSRAGGVIGAYLFVNDSDRYRAIIIDYFWPEMEIYGLGRHVVSTRGHHKLQSTRYDRFFEEQV